MRRALPGFAPALAVTLVSTLLIVVVPLGALVGRAISAGWGPLWAALAGARVAAAFRLSLGASLGAALLDSTVGLLVAWVLVRYRFPGRAIADALVDLPFALPTAVAGIALCALYAPEGWIGRYVGTPIAYARPGVVAALAFVGLPFVVRTVQPVLQSLDPAVEEAAATLGAGRWRTFVQVILPSLAPALLTGFGLALARAIGEYGSIVFISGNLPFRTEIAPVLIVAKLEQYDYVGATAIALALLVVSAGLLFGINIAQARLVARVRR